MNLQGKVVLVTGASRGIGRLVTLRLAQKGASLALVARNKEALDAVASEAQKLRDTGILTVGADLTDLADARAAVDATIARFGRIDVLVNNAGMTNGHDFLHSTPEALAQTCDVNVRALVLMTRLVAEHMVTQRFGHILNMSSLAGVAGMPGEATYSGTKAAVRLFTASLRKELAPHGIRLTDMTIGPTNTELLHSLESNRYTHGMLEGGRKLGAFANLEPERVADAVVKAIEHQKSLVILPTRAWFVFMPFQGLTRAMSQFLTPS